MTDVPSPCFSSCAADFAGDRSEVLALEIVSNAEMDIKWHASNVVM